MTSPLDGQLDRVRASLLSTLDSLPALPTRFTVRVADVAFELEWAEGARAAGPVVVEEVTGTDVPAIRSPSVGTFYRAAEPGAEPFVRVGDTVHKGQQVAIVEAMKLMLPVESDQDGRVASVLPADGDPVQYGQTLFTLEPSDG
ncbi:acetyl-CoA carboxylase biotin carboxyl carrier protein [Saccharothrix tamanrassetensis]|uniref:Biotin carboxyl carrier protein of acetyl-CoA carboxylase n=1 Tax=Saccharothrix tamanrassetensis TaxID=1051531 RepID=A0A841CW03_9PSEU|nr:biotin/lipoyl-containing protein [Saccharothrix tamanrassetensis]MBB5959556.1 acetyl-CoA carboxylase biotin carboxyl carrier protein [Saccharothrix tamanrassetensis]